MRMVPYVPANHLTAHYKFTCAGVDHGMGFTLHHRVESEASPEHALALSSSFVDTVLDNGAGMGDNYTFKGVDVVWVPPVGAPVIEEQPESIEGSLSVNSIPPNCAHLISKRTNLAGRHYRGRIFFPPAMLFDVDIDATGSMTGALAASHTALWEQWRTLLVTAGLPIVLAHQFDADDPPAVFLDPTLVSALVAHSKLATQRRRLR